MLEYVTLLSSILLLIVILYGLYKNGVIIYYSWLISAIAFLILSVALVTLGLDALSLPVTPYLGSIYPSFLALGIIMIRYKKGWLYYLGFILLMLILMAIGSAAYPAIKTTSQIVLHSISGLIIVFLPLYYVVRKKTPSPFIITSLGGITIGIGGLALASIIAGKPLLPIDLVVQILHPILALSALLIAIGIYSVGYIEV